MLQSGILIPVNEQSETTIFDTILTDIGDNQSIENQLSTYSYRLKNMRYFLRKCNEKTLFLIDEFGTGSDPELGGALAEITISNWLLTFSVFFFLFLASVKRWVELNKLNKISKEFDIILLKIYFFRITNQRFNT